MTVSRLYAGFTRGEDGFDCRFGNSATREQRGKTNTMISKPGSGR